MEFGRELLKAERQATSSRTPEPKAIQGTGLPERLRQIATVAPTAAILEARRDLEAAAAEVIARRGFSVTGGPWQLFIVLKREGVLTDAQVSAADSLRTLRNKVAHAYDGEVSEEQAIRYVEVAEGLASTIRGEQPGT